MESVDTLFKKHSNELFSYLCRYTFNSAEAEDILSDVFVKLMEHIEKNNSELFLWRPWLYRVATNCAVSHLRKRKIRSFFLMENKNTFEAGVTPGVSLENDQEGGWAKKAIDQLDHKYRSVLIMQVYQELSYQEIADALNINIGTVRSRLNEAKKKMKKILGETYE
ncbi:MAG: RNA polymerase sigma factor [Deltaproteobacteria bacterium]|nr:RNA polymerase sigma factor [Deltaproteobacteria bacterium]